MNPADLPESPMTPEQMHSALFANLVIQNSQMAFLFLGKMPHPETGEVVKDLEAAQSYIAMLEMLEIKTKGNLDRREEALLKQSISNLRMAFVEEAEGSEFDLGSPVVQEESRSEAPAPAAAPAAAAPVPAAAAPAPASAAPQTPPPAAPAEEPESRKRFTKKY